MPLGPGERAPDYRLRGIDNEFWILGRPDARRSVLVAFFGRDHQSARVLLPFIERIHRRARAREAEVVGISIDSHRDTLEFAADYTLTFPILIETDDGATVRSWKVERQPTLYRLSAQLTVADCMEGWRRREFEEIGKRHLELAEAEVRTVFEPGDTPAEEIAARAVPAVRYPERRPR